MRRSGMPSERASSARGHVLVDDRLHPLPVAVRISYDRDAAAAARDHHRPGILSSASMT